MKEILIFQAHGLIFTECETADGDLLSGEELMELSEKLLAEYPGMFAHPEQMNFTVFFDGDIDYPERFEKYTLLAGGYSGGEFSVSDATAGGELECGGAFAFIEAVYSAEADDLDEDALQETREDLAHALLAEFSCADNQFVSSQFQDYEVRVAEAGDLELLATLQAAKDPENAPCPAGVDFSSFGESGTDPCGFSAPVPLRALLAGDMEKLPEQPGVYMVFTGRDFVPEFRESSPAYHHKGKDPSVGIGELENNWVPGSRVLYIGKAGGKGQAATIRQRFSAYVGFGQGRPYAHWGGRYLWQLANAGECFVAVKTDESPAGLESGLLELFRKKYGRLPFANLRG